MPEKKAKKQVLRQANFSDSKSRTQRAARQNTGPAATSLAQSRARVTLARAGSRGALRSSCDSEEPTAKGGASACAAAVRPEQPLDDAQRAAELASAARRVRRAEQSKARGPWRAGTVRTQHSHGAHFRRKKRPGKAPRRAKAGADGQDELEAARQTRRETASKREWFHSSVATH